MMRSFFLTVVFALWAFSFYSQESVNFKTVDSTTYSLYTGGEWKKLLENGRKGIKQGVDYYYLRMRMGLANYNAGQYIFSAKHFSRALDFNHSDWPAKYYLYASYLYSGKQDMARKLTNSFSKAQKEKLGIKKKTLSGLLFFGGYMFTNNHEKNASLNLLQGDDLYAEHLLIGPQAVLNTGLDMHLSPSVNLFVGYTYLATQQKKRFQYVLDRYYRSSTTPLPGGGYQHNYEVSREIRDDTYDGNITQSEMYLNGKVQLEKGLAFNLFGNILFIGLDQVDATLVSSIRRDTLAYNAVENRYISIDFEEFDYSFREYDTSFVNWLAGFNLQKDFNFLIAAFGASYARLYAADLFQTDLIFTYYPLGNLSFYGQTGGIYLYETDSDPEQRSAFSFYQMLGVKLQKKLWIEGRFYSGDMRNMNINQGAVVFNMPEKVNFMTGIKLLIFVNEHILVDLRYTFSDKSGSYYTFSAGEGPIQHYTSYQTHSLSGGIKWTL
jgi:hypothetical protein